MDIKKILDHASKLRIAVVGDYIEDHYVIGTVDRISPEAPVPVLKITETRKNPGGAGNVMENLRNLGVEVTSFYDENNKIIKTRFMSQGKHLLRVDDEDEPRWMKFDDLNYPIWHGIENHKFDCVVISDYGKGVCSRDMVLKLIQLCNEHDIPTVIDTKHQLHMMYEATLVKCNRSEWDAENKKHYQESPFTWLSDHGGHHLVVTNGSHGMQYWTKNESFELSGDIPGVKVDICDACGAGDTVTAILAICIALSKEIDSLEDACRLANFAAAEVCKHPGVYAITKEDLMKYE